MSEQFVVSRCWLCVMLLIALASLAGCGRVTKKEVAGTYKIDVRDDAGHRYRDTLVLKPGGTFDQTYRPPKGRVMKAHGTWSIKDEWDGTTIDLAGWLDFESVMSDSDRGIDSKVEKSGIAGASISGDDKNVWISLNPDRPDISYKKVSK